MIIKKAGRKPCFLFYQKSNILFANIEIRRKNEHDKY